MTDAEARRVLALVGDPGYVSAADAHVPLENADRLTFEGGKRATTEAVVDLLSLDTPLRGGYTKSDCFYKDFLRRWKR